MDHTFGEVEECCFSTVCGSDTAGAQPSSRAPLAFPYPSGPISTLPLVHRVNSAEHGSLEPPWKLKVKRFGEKQDLFIRIRTFQKGNKFYSEPLEHTKKVSLRRMMPSNWEDSKINCGFNSLELVVAIQHANASREFRTRFRSFPLQSSNPDFPKIKPDLDSSSKIRSKWNRTHYIFN